MRPADLPLIMMKRFGFALVCFACGCAAGQLVLARSATPHSQTILTATQSIIGEQLVYPAAAQAQITAKIITLKPGAVLPWHTHPMPTFGYVLDGEVTVDYGDLGRRTFAKGEALMEAMAHAHRGLNVSAAPVRVLAVSIGVVGQPTATATDQGE